MEQLRFRCRKGLALNIWALTFANIPVRQAAIAVSGLLAGALAALLIR